MCSSNALALVQMLNRMIARTISTLLMMFFVHLLKKIIYPPEVWLR